MASRTGKTEWRISPIDQQILTVSFDNGANGIMNSFIICCDFLGLRHNKSIIANNGLGCYLQNKNPSVKNLRYLTKELILNHLEF
jgi:hypothetical protein